MFNKPKLLLTTGDLRERRQVPEIVSSLSYNQYRQKPKGGRMKSFQKLSFLLAITLLPVLSYSQSYIKWIQRYDGGRRDVANAMVVDRYGNVYITGESDRGATRNDFVTIMYDINGHEKWRAVWNRPYINDNDEAYAIAIDSFGNVIVTGRSYAGPGSQQWDYATVKYDPNGNFLWSQIYNGLGNGNDIAYAVAVDIFGNIYVTGESDDGTEVGQDYATIKYNPEGGQEWVRTYDGTYSGPGTDVAYAIAVDRWGYIYVTGESHGEGNDGFDYLTIKYNPETGDTIWTKRYNSNIDDETDRARALAVDNNGNVYVTGWSEGGATGPDYLTIKYDSNGGLIWLSRYSFTDRDDPDHALAIKINWAGKYVYVTGQSDCDPSVDGVNYQYATVKIDANTGARIWVSTYNGPGTGSDDEDVACAIAVDNQDYVSGTG